MATVPVNGVFRLTMYFNFASRAQVATNRVIGRVVSIAGGGATLDDIAIWCDGTLPSHYQPWMPATLTAYSGTTCQQILPLPAPATSWSAGNAGNNTGTGGALPTQSSGIITFTADGPGPGFRGRMYVPFPCGAVLGTSTASINAAGMIILNDIAATWGIGALIPGLTGGSILVQWGILHNGLTFRPFLYGRAENAFATQRRRSDYGKLNRLPSYFR